VKAMSSINTYIKVGNLRNAGYKITYDKSNPDDENAIKISRPK